MLFNITCGYSILAGTCDISGTSVSAYNSTSNGTLAVAQLPAETGWDLHFTVTYTPPPPAGGGKPAASQVYGVKANRSGKTYTGLANQGNKRTDESWVATASGVVPVGAAKGNQS